MGRHHCLNHQSIRRLEGTHLLMILFLPRLLEMGTWMLQINILPLKIRPKTRTKVTLPAALEHNGAGLPVSMFRPACRISPKSPSVGAGRQVPVSPILLLLQPLYRPASSQHRPQVVHELLLGILPLQQRPFRHSMEPVRWHRPHAFDLGHKD